MKIALITGITGQDGAYLAQYLLKKDYRVFGAFRRSSVANFWRLNYLGIKEHPNLHLISFDILDPTSCIRLVSETQPDELYNLAAQSFVGASFDQPVSTTNATGLGALHLLEAVRIVNSKIKFYQASSSEMFGKVQEPFQNEETKFYPRSPYAVAKLFAHWTTINYRESYNIFATSGILFNHESPLRGEEFVTRKISLAVAKRYLGDNSVLKLGNLDATRDWGFAQEYVEGMHTMLQYHNPDTFVLSTGVTNSVRYFTEKAHEAIGIKIDWIGSGINEIGIDSVTGKELVVVDDKYFRPAEVDSLKGDYSKANKILGWKPKTKLEDLCEIMVKSDIKLLSGSDMASFSTLV